MAAVIDAFEKELLPLRTRLIEHSLFARVSSLEETRLFMESHVFAVWDFMSLVKTLQRELTGTAIPWMPPKNRDAARFINEIVTCEESDEIEPGKYISHFELYLEAMQEGGACTGQIDSFLENLSRNGNFEDALIVADVLPHIRTFVGSTMKFCRLAPHEVAAAFFYGREDIIPEMFTRILGGEMLAGRSCFAKLKIYLERHIEVDGGAHGPMARKVMESLCGNDNAKWMEAENTAIGALKSRHTLWDGVLSSLSTLSDNSTQKTLRKENPLAVLAQ